MKRINLVIVYSLSFIVLAGIVVPISHIPYPVYAQESSPSSSLKEKLEALKKEVASKAAVLKTEVNKKLQNKAYFGSVTDIKEEEITIKTQSGEKVIKVNEYTTYQDKLSTKKGAFELKKIQEGDFISGLGDIDDKGVLIAKKIIRTKDINLTPPIIFWGQIQSVNGATIMIKDPQEKEKSILTNSSTIFMLGNNEAGITDAKVSRFLAGVATKDKEETITSRYIYLIPSIGFTKPDKAIKPSSPSATPKRVKS